MLSLHHIRQARSLREMSLSDRNTGGYYSRKSLSFLKPFLNQSTLIFSIDLKDSSFISFNSLPPKHLGDYPPMARQTHRSPAPSPRLGRPGLQASLLRSASACCKSPPASRRMRSHSETERGDMCGHLSA